MRYQIIVLACLLWTTTISETGTNYDAYVGDFQCYSKAITDCRFMCNFEDHMYTEYETITSINCNNIDEDDSDEDDSDENQSLILKSECNVTIMDVSCLGPNEITWLNNATDKPTCTQAECGCTPVNGNTASDIISDGCSTSNSSNSTIIAAALGALVGLLLVLLVAVTAVLTWTCWQLRKWKGMKCNAEYQLGSSTDHGQLVNPTYEGNDLLHLQQQQPAPAYETIPPHPRDGARLEFIEQGDNGYHILSRERRDNPETNTTTQHMETIPEDSREESYSKLELREESGSTKKANEEEYSKLETMNIGSNLAKDTCLDNDATVVSNDDSSEQTEGKRSVTDEKAFNDDGDVLQLESGDEEKKGQEEETKGEQPLITITPDAQNNRKDSTNPETSTTDNA